MPALDVHDFRFATNDVVPMRVNKLEALRNAIIDLISLNDGSLLGRLSDQLQGDGPLSPDDIGPMDGLIVPVDGEGDTLQTTGAIAIGTKAWEEVGNGRIFQGQWRARVFRDDIASIPASPSTGFFVYDKDGMYLGQHAMTVRPDIMAADGWQDYDDQTTSGAIKAQYPQAAYLRAAFLRTDEGQAVSQISRYRFLDATDVANLSVAIFNLGESIDKINSGAVFSDVIADAGDGSPAVVRLKAGVGGSQITIASEKTVMLNPVDGSLVEVARFQDGIAYLNNALIRNLLVFPRQEATVAFPVQLRPKIYLAKDGDVVSYGGTLGVPASSIIPDLSGLPTPGAGESYDVRAINSLATDFTVRAKLLGSVVLTDQNTGAGSATGGSPAYTVDKPTTADAYNGYYQFNIAMTLSKVYQEPAGGGNVYAEYTGTAYFFANDGSGFVQIGVQSVTESRTTADSAPDTISVSRSITIQHTGVIGMGAFQELGATGVTALSNVKYTTQSAGSETALTVSIPFAVTPSY